MKHEYVSPVRKHIRWMANLNGVVKFGETYAYSFSEVESQLNDVYYNARLINIQFLEA